MSRKTAQVIVAATVLAVVAFFVGRALIADSPDTDQQLQVRADQTYDSSGIDESVKPTYSKLWQGVNDSLGDRTGIDVRYDAKSKIATIIHDGSSISSEAEVVRQAWTILALWGQEAVKLSEVEHVHVQNQISAPDVDGNEVLATGVIIEMTKDQFLKFDWEKLKNQNIEATLTSASTIYIVVPELASKIAPSDLYLVLEYP
ncbi:hypothetical protein A3A68_02435 [Candidatus Saccharibacteria bacterium RIFCSPLOWO2_01_FULL_48_13]|nr:MAG: hypothetical protein A3A68_02435 [Candidatus Saccharibacteria bacterium RIFCSPLOWO2_01_FULL_48_13]